MAQWLRDNASNHLNFSYATIASIATSTLGFEVGAFHVTRLYKALGLNTQARRSAICSNNNTPRRRRPATPARRGPWAHDDGSGVTNPGAFPRRADVTAITAQINTLIRNLGITPNPQFAETASRLCPKE